MSIREQENGRFLVQIDRPGVKRVRKLFDTYAQATEFERQYLADKVEGANVDNRKLNELIELWMRFHGINLSDHAKRQRTLNAMCIELGNPIARLLTAEQFVEYRYKKTMTGTARICAKTFNNHHCYLSAVFNKLKKLKIIDYQSPITEIDFIKIQQRQTSYLDLDQIDTLLNAIRKGCKNKSTYYVAEICLRTGARWGEAERLKAKQIHAGRITYENTKSKKVRTVPVDEEFFTELQEFVCGKTPEQRVFTNCIGAFRRAVKRAGIELPKGQQSHILRHSFASHFTMRGGNILTLKDILGHATIEMTMRYAHLAPDYLRDAVVLNPRSKKTI